MKYQIGTPRGFSGIKPRAGAHPHMGRNTPTGLESDARLPGVPHYDYVNPLFLTIVLEKGANTGIVTEMASISVAAI